MKDTSSYHAADHALPDGGINDLVDRVERGCTVHRPPDFILLQTRDARWRWLMATSFGMGAGLGIMLGVIVALVIRSLG